MRTKTYTGRMSLYARAGRSPHFLSFISIFFFKAVHVVTEYVMALMIRILLCFVYSPRMSL